MLKTSFYTLALTALLTAGGVAVRAESTDNALPNCPIMGEPIDFSVSTETPDGPVYFCCAGCIKKYNADPGKYAKLVAEQRNVLAKRDKVQVKCPVTGETVDPKITVEHDGKTVSFCSEGCVKKFTASPDSYKSGLANAYTFQTKCPVMGETITPKAFSVLPTGETVYFCCKGCDKKFAGDLAKYAPKLASQGINLNLAKIKEMLSHGDDHDHGHDHGDGHDH